MRPVAACTLVLGLGACASEQWANRSGEVASRDVVSECSQRSWARVRYEQLAYPSSVPASVLQRNKSGTAVNVSPSPVPFPQQDLQEQTFFNLCMKEKGFDLVSNGAKP